jgi:PAS domain S-box-containing protein
MFSPDNLSPFLGKEIIFQARKKNEQTFLANVHIWNFEFSRDKYYVFYILDITEKIEHKEAIEQAHNELLLYSAELKNLNSQLEDRIGDRTDKLNKAVEDLKLTNYLLQREIMHKEEALSALKESQRMLETIAENFPNGILYVLNREFRILFAHGQEIKNLGFSSKDLIGKLFLPLEEELTAAEVRGLLSKVLSGEIISFEYHSLVNDNYYLFNMAPLVNEENEATQILSVSQNITSMKRAELEIRKSFERERELNEMKSRFVSTASHEFRTPLTAILSSASLIALYKSTKDEPQRQKHIKRINSSVANLTEILNDFLSLGKLEEGKVRNQPVEFDIRELCEDIRDETGALVKPGQEVILTYRLEETVAFLDIQLVRNIIINLLSNAIKYSPEGSVIELDAVKEGGLLLFSIKDKGIGIPEEDKKHLFETFFRARNVETIKGTGMGLHIVKKYLSLMDGDINFESTLNEGSKFTVKWKV